MKATEHRVLLQELVRQLVNYPDEVEVFADLDGNDTRFEIRVAPPDVGAVLGKGGRTVMALRVLFGRIAAVNGHKAWIRLLGDRQRRSS